MYKIEIPSSLIGDDAKAEDSLSENPTREEVELSEEVRKGKKPAYVSGGTAPYGSVGEPSEGLRELDGAVLSDSSPASNVASVSAASANPAEVEAARLIEAAMHPVKPARSEADAAKAGERVEESIATVAAIDAATGKANTWHRKIMYKLIAGMSIDDIAGQLKLDRGVVAEVVASPAFLIDFRALIAFCQEAVFDIRQAAASYLPEALLKLVDIMRAGTNAQRTQMDAAKWLMEFGVGSSGNGGRFGTTSGAGSLAFGRAGGGSGPGGSGLSPAETQATFHRSVRAAWRRRQSLIGRDGRVQSEIVEERVEESF